jgi:hypothetical protein
MAFTEKKMNVEKPSLKVYSWETSDALTHQPFLGDNSHHLLNAHLLPVETACDPRELS